MPINYLIARVPLQTFPDWVWLDPKLRIYYCLCYELSYYFFKKTITIWAEYVTQRKDTYLECSRPDIWFSALPKEKTAIIIIFHIKHCQTFVVEVYYMSAISWSYLALLSKNTFFNLFVKQLLLNNSLFEVINHLRPACRHEAQHYKSHLIFIHRV